jgi:hypothetical protein
MQTDTGYLDGELFLAKLEEAQAEGDTDFVAAHMPRLERLIAPYMDRTYELSKLQYRARMIREHHEPSVGMRG